MHRELDMRCPVEFGTVPDCACPWEHWHVGAARHCLDIHLEDDATAHLILLVGEDHVERHLPAPVTFAQAKAEAFAWAADMLGESVQ